MYCFDDLLYQRTLLLTNLSRRNQCVNCHTIFGEYHCGVCNLWMSMVCIYSVEFPLFVHLSHFLALIVRGSLKSPSIASNAVFVVSVASKHFVTAMNVACAYQSVSLRRINVSRISTRTIVQCVEKICSRRDNHHKIYPVVMPFMLTVFANWLVLIIDALFAKRLS